VWAALLALALTADPLAPLRNPLAELASRTPRPAVVPTVENVRHALEAVRALETAARPLLARGEKLSQVHRDLATGWAAVEAAETALLVEGESDGPERAAIRSMSASRAEDAHALALFERGDRRDTNPALDACWQEHLLSTDKPDSLDVKVTLALGNGHVTAVEFTPPINRFRAHLGECLTTRLLGWAVLGDADAVELDLHFTAPRP
jgi:hypothetical protein